MRTSSRTVHRLLAGTVALGTTLTLTLGTAPATSAPRVATPTQTAAAAARPGDSTGRLTPRSHFTMAPDGSSGARVGGEGIPNIDSVKSTIATYYGDPGTGIANKVASPYIAELDALVARQTRLLQQRYDRAVARHEKPALVFDADDTTLWTYDMEVAGMHFNFDPALQDVYVQGQRFPATPAMVAFVNRAKKMGYTIFGITGRNDDQKAATVANLKKVGYQGFASVRFHTKWTGKGTSRQPSYVKCVATCTTVEYKAGTRKHIEATGYSIIANFGDQWSDLQGGYADHAVKLPNPTYYLPSTNLPGVEQPRLSPRTSFTMAPDGSSGATVSGEGIPNIDSVKKTIYTYYGDPSATGTAATTSPYAREVRADFRLERKALRQAYRAAVQHGEKPAVVFDVDDTTLLNYPYEVAVHFNFDEALNEQWVADQRFPVVPGSARLIHAAKRMGFTIFGITGRPAGQEADTLANLRKVGITELTADTLFTKWAAGQQPAYVTCAAASCTRVEYKTQTRRHIQRDLGFSILASYGDQYSDLQGRYAVRTVKLPNPTYYLP